MPATPCSQISFLGQSTEATHRAGMSSTPGPKAPLKPNNQGAQPYKGIYLLPLILHLMDLENILEFCENIQRMLLYSCLLCGDSKVLIFKNKVSEVSGNKN